MKRFGLAAVVVGLVAFNAAPASAETLEGRCNVSGVATFGQGIGGFPPVNSTYDFRSSSANCTGSIDGGPERTLTARASVGGPATLSCLAGNGMDAQGAIELLSGGVVVATVSFTMDFVSAGAGVVVSLEGAQGGNAVGFAEFGSSNDSSVVTKCASNTVRSLKFSAVVVSGPDGLSG